MALGGTVSVVVGGLATGFGVEVCCSEKRGEGVVMAAAKVVVMEGVDTEERLPSSVGRGETVTSGNMSVDEDCRHDPESPPHHPPHLASLTLTQNKEAQNKQCSSQ